MTQDKLESRRAFMEKFGKLAVAAAVAAPFMAMAAKEAVVAPDKDSPVTSCTSNCTNKCTNNCTNKCADKCADTCKFGCTGRCEGLCGSGCTGICKIFNPRDKS